MRRRSHRLTRPASTSRIASPPRTNTTVGTSEGFDEFASRLPTGPPPWRSRTGGAVTLGAWAFGGVPRPPGIAAGPLVELVVDCVELVGVACLAAFSASWYPASMFWTTFV